MSMFEQFYIPSETGNVIDFAACKLRSYLHEMGAIDEKGNFYVDQPEYRRLSLGIVTGEVEIDLDSTTY